MRILIAGGHGQVASALISAAARSPDVTALAVGRPALDLCAPATVATALSDGRPDVIINTAAYTAVDKAESDSEAAHRLNCDGAAMIAAEAARRGAPIIHLSTDYVFDGTSQRPYLPDDPTNPLGVYGRTKRDGELAVAAANPEHLIVRTAWVHSPVGVNFVKTMLRLAADRDEIDVVSDQTGAPTYAPHLAEALIVLAVAAVRRRDEPNLWGMYHATGSGRATWADLAEEVFAVSAAQGGPSARVKRISTAEYPTAAHRPANALLDCGTLGAIFGVRMPDWKSGVRSCVMQILAETAPQ
jgi:dTDP-4-dehydrorhamnose reductase